MMTAGSLQQLARVGPLPRPRTGNLLGLRSKNSQQLHSQWAGHAAGSDEPGLCRLWHTLANVSVSFLPPGSSWLCAGEFGVAKTHHYPKMVVVTCQSCQLACGAAARTPEYQSKYAVSSVNCRNSKASLSWDCSDECLQPGNPDNSTPEPTGVCKTPGPPGPPLQNLWMLN
jgi:hypothetical protein